MHRHVESLGACRRHDVSSVARQEEAAEPKRFGHKTAQRRDGFFDRRPGFEALGDFGIESGPKLVPETVVGPVLDLFGLRDLNIVSRTRMRPHRAERKPAMVVRIDQFFSHRRLVNHDAQPAERVHSLEGLDRILRHAGA